MLPQDLISLTSFPSAFPCSFFLMFALPRTQQLYFCRLRFLSQGWPCLQGSMSCFTWPLFKCDSFQPEKKKTRILRFEPQGQCCQVSETNGRRSDHEGWACASTDAGLMLFGRDSLAIPWLGCLLSHKGPALNSPSLPCVEQHKVLIRSQENVATWTRYL